MSATHSRSRVPGAGGQAPRDEHATPPGRRLLAATFGLALAWTATLLVMDVTTARPRTISHDQVRKADVVVIARRIAPDSDRVRVARVFRGPVAEGDELRVRNLPDAREPVEGREVILALSRSRQEFVITKLDGQRSGPLVYPSSPATIDEIKSILRDHDL